MKCEHANHPEGSCEGLVEPRGAETSYHFEGVPNSPEDPNRDLNLCDLHYRLYKEYWDEMWAEYYRGLL